MSHSFIVKIVYYFVVVGERKRTEWSEWHIINTTKDGTTQERIRFTCRAPVEDENYIRISHIKRDTRFCPLGGGVEECKKRGKYRLCVDDSTSHKQNTTDDKLYHKHDIICKLGGVDTKKHKHKQRQKIRLKKENVVNKIDIKNSVYGLRVPRHSIREEMRIFRGFCGCRDLGVLRVCRHCWYKGP